MEVNDAISLLGSYGRWQVLFFIAFSSGMMFPSCFHSLSYIFQAYTPPHHCKISEGSDVNKSIPWDDKFNAYSKCYIYVNGSDGNETRKCSDDINEWQYYGDNSTSIVTDLDLVCGRDYLKRTTYTLHVIGFMIGSLFFTSLADYFGRKPVFLVCNWLMIIVGVGTAFVKDYYWFIVVRFLSGLLRPGYAFPAYILAVELFAAKQRTFAGIMIENFWAVGICLIALFMFLIPDWRHLQLLVSLLCLFTVPFYWIVPESIPWLITKGRIDEAEAIIQRAAKFNGIKNFPASVFEKQRLHVEEKFQTKDDAAGESPDEKKSLGNICKRIFSKKNSAGTKYTLVDVVRHDRLRLFIIVVGLLWIIDAVVYYGMTLNTEELAGNRHLNLFISGIVEIPAYLFSYFIINKCGRRWPLIGLHMIAGVALIVSQFVPSKLANGTSLIPLQVTLNNVGKFGITSTYAIVYIYAPELFPTTVRSQSIGVAALCGRIGSLLAPFTSSLNNIEPWLTGFLFGLVSILGGLLALMLPETNRRPLPQTIDEIDQWYSGKKKTSNGHTVANNNTLPITSPETKCVEALEITRLNPE